MMAGPPPSPPEVPLFPTSVALDTIAHCNARCPFCPLYGPDAEMTRPKGWMPLELSESVLAQVARRREHVSVIYFCFHGEPLLDPHVEARFEQVARHGLGSLVTILTNGQYLDERRAQALLNADVREIMLGFDAATRETYERHRVGCDYDRVLGNVRRFLERRDELQRNHPKDRRTKLSIQYVRTPQNEHEVQSAYDLWGEILEPGVDRFFNTTSRNWATDRLDRGNWILETTRTAGVQRLPCSLLHSSLTVLHDGRIAVCNWDYNGDLAEEGAGNAWHTPLEELWHGAAWRRLREAHARLDFSALQRCEGCVMTRGGVHDDKALGFRTRFGSIQEWRRPSDSATEPLWPTAMASP